MSAYELPENMIAGVGKDLPSLARSIYLASGEDVQLSIKRPAAGAIKKDLRDGRPELTGWYRSWGQFESTHDIVLERSRVVRTNYATVAPPKCIVLKAPYDLKKLLGAGPAKKVDLALKSLESLRDAVRSSSREDTSFPQKSDVKSIMDMCAADVRILIAYFKWRIENPDFTCSLRDLPVPRMHSKFVEDHSGLFISLSRKFGLLHAEEGKLPARLGYQENDSRTLWIKLPSSELGHIIAGNEIAVRPQELLQGNTKRVLVLENFHNFKEVMPSTGTCIFWGRGNEAASLIDEVSWLKNVDTYYFGDCDSYGYKILADCREKVPGIKSILMDQGTIAKNIEGAVQEPESSRIEVKASLLTEEEAAGMYFLKSENGDPFRLEQEKIRNRMHVLERAGLIVSDHNINKLIP